MNDMDLKIRIIGDGAPLRNELTRTAGSIKSVVGQIAAAFGVGIGAAAFVNSVRDAMQYAKALTDVASKLELTTTELQVLREAAMQNSSSDQQLESGLRRLMSTRSEALAGNQIYADSFSTLGIAMSEVRYMSTAQLVEAVGKALVGTTSSSKEFNAALKLMGQDVGALAPLLRTVGEKGFQSFKDGFESSGRQLDKAGVAAMNRLADGMERGKGRIRAKISEIFQGIEWLIPTSLEGPEFDKRVDERMASLKEKADAAGIKRPDAIFRDVARNQLREEDAEKLKSDRAAADAAMEAAAAAEAAKQKEAERWEKINGLISESAQLEEQLRVSRLTDAQRLLEIETKIAALRQQYGETDDYLKAAEIGKQIAELQLEGAPLTDRVAADKAKAEADAAKRAEELAAIESGKGITVTMPSPADQLAAIGGYVGNQTSMQQTLMERQLEVQQRMADYLQRIAEEKSYSGVVP